jgi:hypothetical protein
MLTDRCIGMSEHLCPEISFLLDANCRGTTRERFRRDRPLQAPLTLPPTNGADAHLHKLRDFTDRGPRTLGRQQALTEIDGIGTGHSATVPDPCLNVNATGTRSRLEASGCYCPSRSL